jgi:hypothetical protein
MALETARGVFMVDAMRALQRQSLAPFLIAVLVAAGCSGILPGADGGGDGAGIDVVQDAPDTSDAGGDTAVPDGGSDASLDASGDVPLGDASGDVPLGDAGGDLSLGDASGDVPLGDAGGDLSLGDASGDVPLEDAGGDVPLGDAGGTDAGCTGHGPLPARFACNSRPASTCGACLEALAGGETVCVCLAGTARTDCEALLSCMAPVFFGCLSGGAINACYCSDATCSAGANGPCASAFHAVAGTSDPTQVLEQLRDPNSTVARVAAEGRRFGSTAACGQYCTCL